MPGKDDRDKRRALTPPAGVRAQTAQPFVDFENELTPVEGDVVTQALRRATSAAITSKAAFRKIGDVATSLKAYAENDQRDHVALHHVIGELKISSEKAREEIKELAERLGETRESVAGFKGQLEGMDGKLDGIIESQRGERERATVERRDQLDTDRIRLTYTLKTRSMAWGTVFKVAGGVALAVATALVTYYVSH